MKQSIIIFAAISFFLFSCKNNTEEINSLNSAISGVSDTLQLYTNARTWRLSRIDTLKSAVKEAQSQIYTDSMAMDTYFSNHKMAVACIAAGYVSTKTKLDFTSDYPQIVEDLAGWGIVLSVVYYIFNKEEVDEVIATANIADEKKKGLYADIENDTAYLVQENTALLEIDEAVKIYTARLSDLEQKLLAQK